MAVINQTHKARLEPLETEIQALQQGVQAWCEPNRNRLTQDGKVKFHDFPAGTVKWRMRPPKVTLKSIEMALEALLQRGLDRFVRTRQEVNKDAIRDDPDAVLGVPGIKVEQGEDFIVEPFETRLEEVGK